MARRRRRRPLPKDPVRANIHAFSHEGRGICSVEGKTTFVDNALLGEEVDFIYTEKRGKFDEGLAVEIHQVSEERVTPPCEHADICGGCSLQHMANPAQIAHKQAVLVEQLKHFGAAEDYELVEPMQAEVLGYRRKARLGVKYVPKKGGALVGFREKKSNFLAQIESCAVLDPRVGQLIRPLRDMISQLDTNDKTAQLEVAMGDDQVALVVRHLVELSEKDKELWTAFGQEHGLYIYLQPKGPDTVHLLYGPDERDWLTYKIDAFEVELLFHPMDFTQVNASINQQMVKKAIDWLEPKDEDRILDLFCGLGNFTIPLATVAKNVVGVEGSEAMVERGGMNAKHNNLDNVEFYATNLQDDFTQEAWAQQGFNKVLIDPPRSGALDVVQNITRFNPERIVYVSCNPATLARDAGELKEKGYKLVKAGVMDMFPGTTHTESIALFEKG
ncbi:MAG: 23S rRNA (uracil(1939)-C(5))-methyltransferase RlmD [Gammaproteobacteria bacterium]|nr:23S rRNA (uracil(1939)-C(5))-methyltransferase RlmD [Gammaproteobacteria bacterium]